MITANQNRLLAMLGPDYSVKEIDLEDCIYRKLNSKYDIELSGTARKGRPISIYVWDISNGDGISAQIVEKIHQIKYDVELLTVLNSLAEKYQG